MKNTDYYFFFLLFLLSLFSCQDDDAGSSEIQMSINQENTDLVFIRDNYGTVQDAGIKVQLSELSSSPMAYEFRVLATSTALADVHYTVQSTSDTIPANTWDAVLPIIVFPDSMHADETWTLAIELISSDLGIVLGPSVTFTIKVWCPSELAGTFDAETTDLVVWGSPKWTGTVRWELIDSFNYLVYAMDENHPEALDFSMGDYWNLYGYNTLLPTDENEGSLLIHDDCGTLSFTGTDRWGDTYFFEEIITGGPKAIIYWGNTYGDRACTTLTRQDGKDWPNLNQSWVQFPDACVDETKNSDLIPRPLAAG